MKRAVFLAFAALFLALLGWIAYQRGAIPFLPIQRGADEGASPTTAAGEKDGQGGQGREVKALGRVEPAGGIVDIAAMVGDRLEKFADNVKEGETVGKGDALAYLESRSLRELQFQAAASQATEAEKRREAEKKLAATRVTTAELGVKKAKTVDLDIQAQEKKAALAQANLRLATADRDRLAGLRKERKGLVSQQEWERQLLVVQQAAAEADAAEAMLKKLRQTAQLGQEAAQADLEAARASEPAAVAAIPVESLAKQRDLARKQYEQTEIKAPCAGTVLKILMRPGETVTQVPILEMADLQSMVVVAEVYETDIKRVEVGQTALIESRAFPKPYDKDGLSGTVERIAGMITAPALKHLDPMASTDRRVVAVRIKLEGENRAVAARLVNLQVDVTINPRGRSGAASDPPQKP